MGSGCLYASCVQRYGWVGSFECGVEGSAEQQGKAETTSNVEEDLRELLVDPTR